MSESFLPLEIDVETLRIREIEGTGEWELTITTNDGEEIYEYLQQPDSLFDQLLEKELLVYDENEREYVQNHD